MVQQYIDYILKLRHHQPSTLVFKCPTHDQVLQQMWPDLQFSTDPRRLQFLEEGQGGDMPPLQTRNERERGAYIVFDGYAEGPSSSCCSN